MKTLTDLLILGSTCPPVRFRLTKPRHREMGRREVMMRTEWDRPLDRGAAENELSTFDAGGSISATEANQAPVEELCAVPDGRRRKERKAGDAEDE